MKNLVLQARKIADLFLRKVMQGINLASSKEKYHEIMLFECSGFHWVDVVKSLKKNKVKITYWTAWNKLSDQIVQFNCIYHNTLDAKRGTGYVGWENNEIMPFDIHCQNIWLEEAQTVYDMMNRFDHSCDLNFVERSLLFYKMLIYWNKILTDLSPNLVVFSTPPHVVYDYIVLCLCRKRGIPTLMFEEATIYQPYSLSMNDYLIGSTNILNNGTQTNHINPIISEQTKSIVEKLRSNYDTAKPEREVVAHKDMEKIRAAGLSGMVEQMNSIIESDNKFKGLYTINEKIVNVSSLYKEKGQTLSDSFEGKFANSRYIKQVHEERLKTDKLYKLYNSLCIEPNKILSKKFIYMPLAGQPERTTSPQAELFSNQILMVNMLSSAIPEDWLIVVREHPNQFHPNFAVNMCRSEEYYKELVALKNVRLISTNEVPFTILDNAMAVATTGGTSGIEAIARGKPCILFGNAWYRDCPGIIRVRNILDVQLAINSIINDMKIEPCHIEAYLENISKTCFKGLADALPSGFEVDPKENVNNLTKIILERLSVC